jgi:hypothetical protein
MMMRKFNRALATRTTSRTDRQITAFQEKNLLYVCITGPVEKNVSCGDFVTVQYTNWNRNQCCVDMDDIALSDFFWLFSH